MTRFLVGVLSAMFLFASCSSGTSPDELWRTQGLWELNNLGGATISDPENYTIQFSEDGRVSIQADCNRCFGNYGIDGNAITMGPALGCTRAFCGDDSFFDEYVMALGSATSFTRRGDTLEIPYSGGVMSFTVAQ